LARLKNVEKFHRRKAILNQSSLRLYSEVSKKIPGFVHPVLNVSANTLDHPTYWYLILVSSNILKDMRDQHFGIEYTGNSSSDRSRG